MLTVGEGTGILLNAAGLTLVHIVQRASAALGYQASIAINRRQIAIWGY
jgi:hypothetical protein